MAAGDRSGLAEFRVLGPLEVVAGTRPIGIKPAKARALLALLLLDPGRAVAADRLIAELWAEAPPASAAVSLRVLVSRLREALASAGAPDAIETRPAGYALSVEPSQIDAARFEALLARGHSELEGGQADAAAASLRDGLALWRGPALADITDAAAVSGEAARLDELHLVALEDRIEADLACARHDLVVGELEQLVRAHPFRERLWRALMLALYRCGRQADALAAFSKVRERLIDELGIEPPALRVLHQQILEQSPDLSLAPPEPSERGGEDLPTGVVTFLLTDVAGSSRLWERSPGAMASALERLEEIIRRAVMGAGGAVVKARGEGDSAFSVFARASDAVRAALALQAEVGTEPWPGGIELKLRIALHTGEARERDADYFGAAVNRAARLRSLAQPGQILLSQATAQVAGDELPSEASLADLGRRGLRGLSRDERVFELRVVASAAGADALPEFNRKLPNELAVASEVFVGRQAETEVLAGVWSAAVEGSLRSALLAGEPGIGKTRLAAELARRADAEGGVVLFGRCDEDLGVPFQPFAQALRAYVMACPSAELATQAGQRAGDLVRLVPELGERLLGVRPTSTGDPEEQRDRLFEAVVTLLAGASRARPVLLVLDDLHWAARPTLLMLRHLLRSREPMRLLLLGTYRDTELDRAHPLAEVLADLRREPVQIERLRLRGLDADAVGAYVAATGGQALGAENIEFVRTLYESTEGNPFFIGEVLRHVVESGLARQEDGRWVTAEIADVGLPEGVKDVITRRLSRLSEAANRALAMASVVGPTFSLPVLERAEIEGNPDDLLDALEEGLRAGLISEKAPSSYSFTHALIRQTLYGELTSTRRVRLHRRIGEAIEQAPNADRQVEALAYHFAEAALDGQIAKAADYALAAGHRALDRLDPEEAVARLERGIELLDLEPTTDHARRADLLLALAQARSELLDMEGNHAAALSAADSARAIGSAEALARAALVYWPPAGTGVDDPTLPQLLEQALDAVGDDHPTLRVLLTTRLTFYRAYPLGQGFDHIDEAERALALARRTDNDEALAAALRLTIRVLYGTTRIAEQVSLADELLATGRRTGEHRSELLALAFRCNAHIQLADRMGYEADLLELRRRAADVGTRRAKYILAVTQGLQALMEGRFAEVERLSEQALAFGGLQTDRLAGHPARITRLYWERGRLEDAIDTSREWAERIRGHPVARACTARLQAELGDQESAKGVLDELMASDLAAVPRDLHWPCVLADLAALCTHLRDAEQARRISALLQPYRGYVLLMGGIVCVDAVDRFLGMLAHTLGRLDDAVAHYTIALELEQRLKATPLAARTRYWFARALHARGTPTDDGHAVKFLRGTLATAQELGMSGLVAEVQELLGPRGKASPDDQLPP